MARNGHSKVNDLARPSLRKSHAQSGALQQMNNDGTPKPITGTVSRILYRNVGDDGFTVLDVASDHGNKFLAVGNFSGVERNARIQMTGQWQMHRKYGDQFVASGWQPLMPDTIDGLRVHLSSGAIRSIGPALAQRIVERFGQDTVRIFDEEPQRLAEIRGNSIAKVKDIAEAWANGHAVRQLAVIFSKHGLTLNLALRVHRHFQAQAVHIVKPTPYRLTEISGVGFLTADKIAMAMGVETRPPVADRCGGDIHARRDGRRGPRVRAPSRRGQSCGCSYRM